MVTNNRFIILIIVFSLSFLTRAELLTNGGFEQGNTGSFSSGYPEGWLGWGTNGHQHDYSGQTIDLKAAAIWWGDSGLYQNVPVTGGEIYTFSCKMLTPSDDRIIQWNGLIKAEYYDANGQQLLMEEVGRLYDTDASDAWKTVTATFRAPVSSMTGRIVLMFDGNGSGSGRINFDEASIIHKTAAELNPDFNEDGIVNLPDLAQLGTAWLRASSIYDFNGDTFIDLADFQKLASYWLYIPEPVTMNINDQVTYQQIDGFGASLTDSSAWLIYKFLTPADRPGLMTELFDPDAGIGLSYLRQPMGTSDMRRQADYSYDDTPNNQDDFSLSYFSIDKDRDYIIPVIQEALLINPSINVMGSPWSPPPWMKTNKGYAGGHLRDDDAIYNTYADYFVRYIQAYQAEGISIHAVTLQNEAGLEVNYPSLNMTAADQIRLVNILGPKFEANNIDTKIVVYDWNWRSPSGYGPLEILSDTKSRSYIDGVAWHHYEGSVTEQTTVHNAYPAENTYFTEGALGTWMKLDMEGYLLRAGNLIADTTRNWAKTVILWNMALYDPSDGGPIMAGYDGCRTCYGVVTIDKTSGKVIKRPQYYALGQASKFIKSGAYRVDSNPTTDDGINSVAFKNEDQSVAVFAVNNNYQTTNLKIQWNQHSLTYPLAARSITTLTWPNTQSRTVQVWVTTGNQTKLLQRQPDTTFDN